MLPKTKFVGYCRFEKILERHNWVKIKFGITSKSAEDCHGKCQIYGENRQEKDACVAFSFTPIKEKNCDLYKGGKDGPYTFGEGNPSATCYVMPKGTLI